MTDTIENICTLGEFGLTVQVDSIGSEPLPIRIAVMLPIRISHMLGSRTLPAEAARHQVLAAFSNVASTSFKRHVQSLHELGDRRNPDVLAGVFLSVEERERCAALDAAALAAMRADPYYYYLVARTKAHDQALLDALVRGVRRVAILGAGFDTRFYRFGGLLATHGVEVAEFDQPDAIGQKSHLARGLPHAARVAYLPIDLNRPPSWDALWNWVSASPAPLLLLAEGVSPYIVTEAFVGFLGATAGRLPAGSRLAYDFKRPGVADAFGRSAAVTQPFRLAADDSAVAAMHRPMGFQHWQLLSSAALMKEHVPSWTPEVSSLFQEDALLLAAR